MLWAALTMMDHVPVAGGRPCLFRVLRVSGTMRKAEEEAIRQARQRILAAKAASTAAAARELSSLSEDAALILSADSGDEAADSV